MESPKKTEKEEINMGIDTTGMNPNLRKAQQHYLEQPAPFNHDENNHLIAQELRERRKQHG